MLNFVNRSLAKKDDALSLWSRQNQQKNWETSLLQLGSGWVQSKNVGSRKFWDKVISAPIFDKRLQQICSVGHERHQSGCKSLHQEEVLCDAISVASLELWDVATVTKKMTDVFA